MDDLVENSAQSSDESKPIAKAGVEETEEAPEEDYEGIVPIWFGANWMKANRLSVNYDIPRVEQRDEHGYLTATIPLSKTAIIPGGGVKLKLLGEPRSIPWGSDLLYSPGEGPTPPQIDWKMPVEGRKGDGSEDHKSKYTRTTLTPRNQGHG